MNIRNRVLVSAGLAVLATLCCGALLAVGASRSIAADAEQERVQATSRGIAALVTLTNEYALHAEPRAAEQWQQQLDALSATLSSPVQSGETSASRLALRSSAAGLPPLFHHLIELNAQPASPLTQRRRELLVDHLLARTQALTDAAYRWSREAASLEQVARRWLRLGGAAALILLLGATVAQPIVVWRRVLRPLAVLGEAATAVERGDLRARCASTANDELGHVARRFDAMTVALGERSADLQRSERRLRAITDNMPALVTHVDTDERYTFVSAYIERALGVRADEVAGTTMRDFCGAGMYAELAPYIRAALQGQKTAFESRVVLNGTLHHYLSNYIPDTGDDGEVRGFYGISFDITERKESEMRQAASERQLRTVADNLPVLIAYIDSGQRYRFCNATFKQWFGAPASRFVGQRVVDALGESVYALRRPYIERALAGERIEFDQSTQLNGEHRELHGLYVPHQEDGVTLGLYALVTDVTAIKRNEDELMRLARFDSLTNLPNRRQFDEKLADAMARSRRSRRPLALLYLDIDLFKSINDSDGHAAGDAVLKEFALRCKNAVRVTDTVARLAGDEFVIILDALQAAAEAEQVARKIVLAVREDFLIDVTPRKVTTSVGVAFFLSDATTPDELMALADAALYEAKGAGRDGYRVARPVRTALRAS